MCVPVVVGFQLNVMFVLAPAARSFMVIQVMGVVPSSILVVNLPVLVVPLFLMVAVSV